MGNSDLKHVVDWGKEPWRAGMNERRALGVIAEHLLKVEERAAPKPEEPPGVVAERVHRRLVARQYVRDGVALVTISDAVAVVKGELGTFDARGAQEAAKEEFVHGDDCVREAAVREAVRASLERVRGALHAGHYPDVNGSPRRPHALFNEVVDAELARCGISKP